MGGAWCLARFVKGVNNEKTGYLGPLENLVEKCA